jgi:hypothetical protein
MHWSISLSHTQESKRPLLRANMSSVSSQVKQPATRTRGLNLPGDIVPQGWPGQISVSLVQIGMAYRHPTEDQWIATSAPETASDAESRIDGNHARGLDKTDWHPYVLPTGISVRRACRRPNTGDPSCR